MLAPTYRHSDDNYSYLLCNYGFFILHIGLIVYLFWAQTNLALLWQAETIEVVEEALTKSYKAVLKTQHYLWVSINEYQEMKTKLTVKWYQLAVNDI